MVLNFATVAANVARIRERVASACERVGRGSDDVRLVAASKTVPPAGIRAAAAAGVVEFGENYVHELRDKRAVVDAARWHYIGTLQSRTAPRVAELADVVQTLAPGHATDRLARRAAERGQELDTMIEVDFAGRGSGVNAAECERFADGVAAVDGLRLVGLMTLPPSTPSAEDARPYFVRLRELRDRVANAHPHAAHLSMGMSLDYEVAVEEGATIVRIGTALFGARPPAHGRG